MKKWTKEVFINNNIPGISSHSCRPASTSKARAINVHMDDIIGLGKTLLHFIVKT